MTDWHHFPTSVTPPSHVRAIIDHFDACAEEIDSEAHGLKSNEVLAQIRPGMVEQGFLVESEEARIPLPVLYGLNGKVEKQFKVDAYHPGTRTVMEIEAGRAIVNNAIYLDLVKACVLPEVDYLVLAVPMKYSGSNVFVETCRMLSTVFASARFQLPLKGVTAIGY